MNSKDRADLPEDVLKAKADLDRIIDNPDLQWEALNKQIWILDYIQGMEFDTISKITGLTIEMIES